MIRPFIIRPKKGHNKAFITVMFPIDDYNNFFCHRNNDFLMLNLDEILEHDFVSFAKNE